MRSIRSFFFLLVGAASSFRCGPSRPCPLGIDFAAGLLDGVGYEVEEDAGAGDDEDPELDGLGRRLSLGRGSRLTRIFCSLFT